MGVSKTTLSTRERERARERARTIISSVMSKFEAMTAAEWIKCRLTR